MNQSLGKGSKDRLKKQKKVLIAIVIGVGFVAWGFGYLFVEDSHRPPTVRHHANIDLPGDKLNPQDIWMNRIESQNKITEQKFKYLEEIVIENKKQEEVTEKEKRALKAEISQLKKQLKEIPEGNNIQSLQTNDPLFYPSGEPLMHAPLVEISMEDPPEKVKHVDRTIPSGTTVKALLVSSVDADCGVYSSTDPIPVKLRILDDGHLPKNVDVKLKGGIIIGSAFGNISSERVYMRLERLTQVNKGGKFIETEVTGYVSGEDGKYGVRGTVVDKSEKIVANAAISGLFGEASHILQSAIGRFTVDNYFSANQSSRNENFSSGVAGSTSNGFDMLSDYYIKRAEKVKPVIQVNAGRIVDITFTHGVEIGDIHTQDKLRKIREGNRK